MKWRPFYVFPRELWKVKRTKILLEKWPINGELITVITRLKEGFKASNIPISSILGETQSYVRFSLPSREISKVERQLGVARVFCGWFVHFLYKSVLLICVSETLGTRLVHETFSLL